MRDSQEICRRPLVEIRNALRSGELTCVEVTQAYLDRIEDVDSQLTAFLSVDASGALDCARRIDPVSDARPLAGVPVALKDNLSTRGLRTTCGSRILEDFVPPTDAFVVERLRQAGAIILGKTNLDEFAMGSSTEHSAFHPTHNPWDLDRVPGGSSGGSAAAVAAGLAAGALGSDTGGSIRQPAAFCATVGLKPTYGRVSRRGLVAFASSLDQVGPLARTVEDAALLLEVIAAPDRLDATCSARPSEEYLAGLGRSVEGLRVGVVSSPPGEGLSDSVRDPVEAALKRLQSLGCRLQEVDFFNLEEAVAVYYVLAPAEASSNLARYDGVRFGRRADGYQGLSELYRRTRTEGLGSEVKRRIMIGTYVLSSGYIDAYYTQAARVRRLIHDDFDRLFREVDVLVGPTTPTLPFRLGERIDNPLKMYLSDLFTVPANLAGIPALSLPCGFSEDGLPVGLQLQAPHFREKRLLQLAYALEQDLTSKRPPMVV